MTALDVIALLMTPLGGLAVGGAIYCIAARPRDPRHPADWRPSDRSNSTG
jgi:hypothetical protein